MKHTVLEIVEIVRKFNIFDFIYYIEIDENNNSIKKIMNKKGISSNYNDELNDNIFIYYDNRHCVGIDFK